MRKKVVVDTNILLHYLDQGGEGFEVILRIIEKCKDLKIISCPKMLTELTETLLKRRKFAPRYADMIVRNLIITLQGFKKLTIYSFQPLPLAFDMNRKDKYFCEFSIQNDVSYIVSNDDRHFQPIKEQMRQNYNINVVSSSDFLNIEGHLEDWNRFKSFFDHY